MTSKKTERFWVIAVCLGIVVLASIPYIVGLAITPEGSRYLGFTYDYDDICAYLSWMRQAADGRLFLQNLFTTEPQTGRGFNLFFLALGSFARITHLPLEIVFHLARVIFGFLLLMAAYRFSGIWLKDRRSRLIALVVVGLSAGFGGIYPGGYYGPMDLWQPEAITFYSIYFSPVFTLPMLLMIGIVFLLLRYADRGEWKDAVHAGLLLFLLANIHTYDLIPLAVLWLLYSAYKAARRDFRAIKGGLIAAVIASPMAAYQIHFYLSEPIFRARAAVETLSPSFYWYLLGYGLLVPLAGICIWRSIKEKKDVSVLVCWVAAGFIAAYLPIPFQRKLIMGTHIPLSLLAAIGLLYLSDRIRLGHRNVLPVILIVLMFPTNLRAMVRDIKRLAQNNMQVPAHVPYVALEEMDCLNYLRTHGKPSDIILAHPGFSSIIPPYTGLRVYCGHWGETVDFQGKLRKMEAFFRWDTPEYYRLSLLRRERITYFVEYHSGVYWGEAFVDFTENPAPYLTPVFENNLMTVYRVHTQ